MSCVMKKPAFCLCKNKRKDQLHTDHAADQHLCFRYTDSPLLHESKISDLWQSSVAVQPGLCRTSWKSQDRFSCDADQIDHGDTLTTDAYISLAFNTYPTSSLYISLVLRKPVFGVSDQVPHKPGCTATEDG